MIETTMKSCHYSYHGEFGVWYIWDILFQATIMHSLLVHSIDGGTVQALVIGHLLHLLLLKGEGGVKPESLNGAQTGFCLAPIPSLPLHHACLPTTPNAAVLCKQRQGTCTTYVECSYCSKFTHLAAMLATLVENNQCPPACATLCRIMATSHHHGYHI